MSTLDLQQENKLEASQALTPGAVLPQDILLEDSAKRSNGEVSLLADGEAPDSKKLKLNGSDAAAASTEMPVSMPPFGGPSESSPVTGDGNDGNNSNDGVLQIHLDHPEGDGVLIPAAKEGISFFADADVLSGRGGGTNVHPGNRNFRDLINLHRRAYLKARKNDKPAISRAIVRAIRDNNGKFLKKDEKSGLWFEIGDDAAREKTSQALRQRAPEMRKLLFDTEREEARAAVEEQMRQQQRMLMGMNPNQQQQQQQMEMVVGPNGMPQMAPTLVGGVPMGMPGMPPGGVGPGMFPNPALFVMSNNNNNGGKQNGANSNNNTMPQQPNNLPHPGGQDQQGFAQQMQMAALLGGGMNRYASNGA
jgi:hypothetical protein